MKNERKLAIEKRDETLKSLTQIDDNLWAMVYKSSYELDAFLEKGSKGIMDCVKHLQSSVKMTGVVPNTDKDGFACSTFNAKSPEGDYLLGRNFDYMAAPCIVCWTAPENGYKSVSVADTTFLAHGKKYMSLEKSKSKMRAMGAPYTSMDGINEKGLSIGVLQVKTKSTKQNTGKTPIVTIVAIRGVLDKCATVDEAIKFFSSYDMHDMLGISYHYQIADAGGHSAIIEFVDNKMYVIEQKKKDDNLMLTNFFLTPGGDNSHGKGMDRYEKMQQRLAETDGVISVDGAMELLSEVKLNYRHKLGHMVISLWSAVYNCNEKSMLLCAGMDYSKKYKFYVDKPGEIIKL